MGNDANGSVRPRADTKVSAVYVPGFSHRGDGMIVFLKYPSRTLYKNIAFYRQLQESRSTVVEPLAADLFSEVFEYGQWRLEDASADSRERSSKNQRW